jgi:hypothetical protein
VVRENQKRIENATGKGTLPYWMKDNSKFINPKIEPSERYNIIGKEDNQALATKGLLLDPMGVNSLLSLIDFMKNKVAPQLRKIAFENMLKSEKYTKEAGVYFIKGAVYNKTEKQTAIKLSKTEYYVVFPSISQIKAIKKSAEDKDKKINDVYLYDKKTYLQYKADLKTPGDPAIKTISEHISSGSQQAPVIILDITGKVAKKDLIKGIRDGWTKTTKVILLNYKGQWYEIKKENIFKQNWLETNIR